MAAKINYLNIGIVVILLVSGVFASYQQGQQEKAVIATGVNEFGSRVSTWTFAGSFVDAAPAITVNQVNNSMVVTSGFTILVIVAVALMVFFLMGFVSCFAGCARC